MQRHSIRAWLCGVSVAVTATLATADVWFSHDVSVTALAPPPGNAVFVAPDVQDIFFSSPYIRVTPGPNLGNSLAADNPAFLGLLPGDNIDAIHQERRKLGTNYVWAPAVVFSTDIAAQGWPGTPLRAQRPANAADLYESNGQGYQILDMNENQIGLAAQRLTDVDAVMLTPSWEVDPVGWIYFSLSPGSPTLAMLGASPADILASRIGGTPKISITALQLGLDPMDDDVDGLIMLDGGDLNDDGDFEELTDGKPMVIFSVSHGSYGLPGTAVDLQRLTDPPVGGDVFSSLCLYSNTLFMDDGQYGLSLHPKDNIDGLDLPEMAVPSDYPGDPLFPPGTPFTGGLSMPGLPPPPPPPGGGLPAVCLGLCKKGNSEGSCTLTIRVQVSCTGGDCSFKRDVVVPCDDRNEANGSEIVQAVTLIAQTLAGMVLNCGGPDNGKPVFAGPGTLFGSGPPPHVALSMPVNGALVDCKVTGASIQLNKCDCYTQNVGPKKKIIGQVAFAPWEGDMITSIGMQGEIEDGYYMLQIGKDGPAMYFPIPGGPAKSAIAALQSQLVDYGFVVIQHSENEIWILADSEGNPVSDIYGAGFELGGNGYGWVGVFMPGTEWWTEKENFICAD